MRIIPTNALPGTEAIYGHGVIFEIRDDGEVSAVCGETIAVRFAPEELTAEQIENCFVLALKRVKARLL